MEPQWNRMNCICTYERDVRYGLGVHVSLVKVRRDKIKNTYTSVE